MTEVQYKVNENNTDLMIKYNKMTLCDSEFNCNRIKFSNGVYSIDWLGDPTREVCTITVNGNTATCIYPPDTTVYTWDNQSSMYINDIYFLKIHSACDEDKLSFNVQDYYGYGVASFTNSI